MRGEKGGQGAGSSRDKKTEDEAGACIMRLLELATRIWNYDC